MNLKKKSIIKILIGILVIAFTIVVVNFTGEYFKGQLKLQMVAINIIPASAEKSNPPVFSLCKSTEKCTKKITLKFLLDNGKYINELSLGQGIIKNSKNVVLPLSLKEDKGNNVKLARNGKETKIPVGPITTKTDDVINLRGATAISFIVPDTGEFDLLGLGYFFPAPATAEEIRVIKMITRDLKSADGKSRILTVNPDFLIPRTGERVTEDILKYADDISAKIAKRFNTNKVPFYLIVISSRFTTDFFISPSGYYTSGGIQYNLQNMPSKYGINFEHIFPSCLKAGDYTKVKCYNNPASLKNLTYTLSHELTHVLQASIGTNKKVNYDLSYLEGTAELNALTLNGFDWAAVNNKYKTTDHCDKLPDVYKKGMCIIQYFKDEINESNIKNFVFLNSNYNFSGNKFCDTWFNLMKFVTGSDLQNKKADYSKNICTS